MNTRPHSRRMLPTCCLMALLSITACTQDGEATTLNLCSVETMGVAATEDADLPVSADGGLLGAEGRFLWAFSTQLAYSGGCTDEEDPAEMTPPEGIPASEETEYTQLYNLEVRVAGQAAEVVSAFDLSSPVWYVDLDGLNQYSDCGTCGECMACDAFGCGGCETACMGCTQVVVFQSPPLSPDLGQLSSDGTTLSTHITLTTPAGSTDDFHYSFATPCHDGLDNDGDGTIDAEDPACQLAGAWSETEQCRDGLDNDGDGQVDTNDPDCESELDSNESSN